MFSANNETADMRLSDSTSYPMTPGHLFTLLTCSTAASLIRSFSTGQRTGGDTFTAAEPSDQSL